MNVKKKIRKAFSLVEISVVILVIGILVAGITSSAKLVSEFQLQTARTLTTSSPVSGIKDLMLWYETSLESSFSSSERTNQATVSNWYDNNPQKPVKNNATQTTTSEKPLFIEGAFPNNIPGIRFDGVNDSLPFDASFLLYTSYTIFAVEQRRSSVSNNFFLGGTGSSINENLMLGYRLDDTFDFSHYYLNVSYTVSVYDQPRPTINTMLLNQSVIRKYWRNGTFYSAQAGRDLTRTSPLTSFPGARIGRWGFNTAFDGDLAEIIMYSRAITDEERKSVESYLSQKYNIKIAK